MTEEAEMAKGGQLKEAGIGSLLASERSWLCSPECTPGFHLKRAQWVVGFNYSFAFSHVMEFCSSLFKEL